MPTANSIPPIELIARPVGKFNWSCPNCGQEYPLAAVPWRHLDVRCQRCKAKFQMGVGFSVTAGAQSYILGKWNNFTVNRLDPIGTAYSGAQLYGNVEFICPACKVPQTEFLDYSGRLSCKNCAKPYFVSLLLYRLPQKGKIHVKTPADTIVKGLPDVQNEDVQPVDFTSDSSFLGPPSDRLGRVS